jgi:tetratricopeptide (TPR) repeat protein
MYKAEFKRVALIDHLLKTGNHDALSRLVGEEVGRNLLGDEALNAARMLRLPATVVFLSTLAVENLPKSHHQRAWLALYQSIIRQQEQPQLADLPRRHPFKVFGRALIRGGDLDISALQACHAGTDIWLQVAELCMDQNRFDLLDGLVKELARRGLDVQDWLRLAQTLVNRHPRISKEANTEPLGRCYIRILGNLHSTLPVVASVRSRLALFAARAFFTAGQFAATIEVARMATAPDHQLHALYETACAYCHSGELDQAIQYLDRMVPLFCAQEFRADLEARRALDHLDKADRKGFDPEQAAQALVDLQNALSSVGQKAFLVSGTLLGYAREGRILAHDKDIDVGIVGWEGQYEVLAALFDSRQFRLDVHYLRGSKTHYLPVQHIASGVVIDIFIYHPENGKLVTGVESCFGYLQRFAFTPFDLKAVHFLGIDFYVPADVELNLAENFGDWHVSDPDYISHLQSPSTMDVGGKVFQIVGRLRALEAIRAGQHEKLRRVIEIMEENQNREGGMSQALLDLMRHVQQEGIPELTEEAA